MRKCLLFSTLIVLLFSACKKDTDGDAQPTTYRVDGIRDFTISRTFTGGYTYFNITTSPTGKIQEHVDLSIENLPAGIGAVVSNPSGIPTFSGSITFTDTNAVGGKYPVKLVCNGSITGRKSYTFYITAMPIADCSATLAGTWTKTNSYCVQNNAYYADNIAATNTPGRIVFNNFENAGIQMYADMDCSTGRFYLVPQTINGISYTGNGYYSASYISGYYYKTVNGTQTSCNIYWQR